MESNAQPPQEERAPGQEQQQPQQDQQQPQGEPAPAPAPAGADEGQPKEVSNEQVVHALRELLKTADLNTLSEKQARKQVEQQLGIELSGRKEVIKKEIESWLAAQQGEGEGEGSEEEEEEEEEEQGEKKPKTRGAGRGKRKAGNEKGKKKGGGGFSKACPLSPALAAFLGKEREARGQVVKSIWDYIKANGLQDPKNKRNVICDGKLKTIFKPPINMFNMNKQLTNHIYKDEDGSEPASKHASEEAEEDGSDEGEEEGEGKPSKQKARPKKAAKKDESGTGKGNAFTRPLQLSEKLSDFLGGQQQMSRPDLTRRFWDYFKENNLQNPNDKREIICNDQLKNLFGVDKFTGFGLMKHLKPHLLS